MAFPFRFVWTRPSRRRRARCCETEDCRKESSSSISVTDLSPSQRRQRIKSRTSCESAFKNSLARPAYFVISAKSPEEDDEFLVFAAAAANLAAGREPKAAERFCASFRTRRADPFSCGRFEVLRFNIEFHEERIIARWDRFHDPAISRFEPLICYISHIIFVLSHISNAPRTRHTFM